MELEEAGAVARRALGKHRDDVAVGQRFDRMAIDRMRVAPPFALDEERADVRDEPADDRHAPEVRLGDEPRRLERS